MAAGTPIVITGPAGCCCGGGCSVCGRPLAFDLAHLEVHFGGTDCAGEMFAGSGAIPLSIIASSPPTLLASKLFRSCPYVDPDDGLTKYQYVAEWYVKIRCNAGGSGLELFTWYNHTPGNTGAPFYCSDPCRVDGNYLGQTVSTGGPVCDAGGFVSQQWTIHAPAAPPSSPGGATTACDWYVTLVAV